MSAAALVLLCALDLLGRSPNRLPRIEILDARPPGVSSNADAFANLSEGVIYLVASAPAFSLARSAQGSPAQCREIDAVKVVASIIVHEEWHLTHGPDEEGAYYAQLMELLRLGLGPGRPEYASVRRAMRAVLGAQSRVRAERPGVDGLDRD